MEKIRLIGPSDEKNKMIDYCYKRGFRIIFGGPKRISVSRIDSKRFVIIAEREVEDDG